VNEEVHTAEWIVSRLESDTGAGGLFDPAAALKPTGVYYQLIQEGRELPAIRFHIQDSRDIRIIGSERILVRLDWYVLLVNEGLEVAPLLPLVDRLDTRLHKASGETSTLRVEACLRINPFSIIEPDDSGVQYRHVGGVYRTMVSSK